MKKLTTQSSSRCDIKQAILFNFLFSTDFISRLQKIILIGLFFVFSSSWSQTTNFLYGFETTANDTNQWSLNIETARGDFYGKVTAGNFTRFVGYHSVAVNIDKTILQHNNN